MKRIVKAILISSIVLLTVLSIVAIAGLTWHARSKLPLRSGTLTLEGLQSEVTVSYDDRGVPHIRAKHQADLYRALGYVHAQDRLFQMEMVRRLARGELAEILGPKLLDVDKLFRTLSLRAHADAYIAKLDPANPAVKALNAYLDGINQYQANRPTPLEFELLGIPKRPFVPADVVAVSGYLSYSFAAALKTEPVLTYVRDQLGAGYLKMFDLDWRPLGVLGAQAGAARQDTTPLAENDWQELARISELSQHALSQAGLPQLEGSNAWVIAGQRTSSGRPLLAGDPHISFAAPAVWYEAHLMAPGFELYGHFQALNPFALLGHNKHFGWSLTMFQNDDMDLVAEKTNPANPAQVWHQGAWVDLQQREEIIAVKGAKPLKMTVRRSPNGPIINDVFTESLGQRRPIAMWWVFLESENPILDAFHQLNRADTLEKARNAVSKIHSPGLNVLWANARGDIAWWAAGRLPQRPEQVHPSFILDAASGEADKPGFYRFADNPQEENPARGYIVSANHQPTPRSGVPVYGYYNLPDRAQWLDEQLQQTGIQWNLHNSQALQLGHATGYGPRLLKPLMPVLRTVVTDTHELALLDHLARWNGEHGLDQVAPTVFNQFVYELARAALADELGELQFKNLLGTRALDHALPRLTADALSPWWDVRGTPEVEDRTDTVRTAWSATMRHLRKALGTTPADWVWGQAHTLTHNHPLGRQKPLHLLFDIGPFKVPGGRETPNNLSYPVGPAPWAVSYGPSTRRLLDFSTPERGLGINPVGQSGVLFDPHYADQASAFVAGEYRRMHLDGPDIARHLRSTLVLTSQR